MITTKSLTAGIAAASLVSVIGLAYAQSYDEPIQQDANGNLSQVQQDQQMDRSQTQDLKSQDMNVQQQSQTSDSLQADPAQSRIAADEPAAVPPVDASDYTMPQASDQQYSEPAPVERAPQADRN